MNIFNFESFESTTMEYIFPMIYRTIMVKLTWNNESIRENSILYDQFP